METMYPGIPFSPQTQLTDTIGAGDTIIPVADVSAFPDAPNYATIGTDADGETVKYTAKTTSSLSGCTRGVEGTAKTWPSGSIIARNFTKVDLDAVQKNLENHDNELTAQTEQLTEKYSADNPPPYPVTSVAGKTGAVSLTKSDVDLSNVDNVKQYSETNPPPYPVTSVAGQTGDVELSKSDVGLTNVDNVKQYSASNPPPYPVTSVNGNTGAVTVLTPKKYTGTFSTTWSADTVYAYKQSITISGLKATYTVPPIVDVSLPRTSADTDSASLEGFALIQDFDTAANSLTAYCMGDAPTVSIPVIITVFE